ncbi:MAG: hypothetical protein R2873_26350 [Caldilineaceae bacterium]
MDPSNRREAMKEVAIDVAEERGHAHGQSRPCPTSTSSPTCAAVSTCPTAAYQVSGECVPMIHAAAANSWLDLQRSALESLIGIKQQSRHDPHVLCQGREARWITRG